MIGKIEHQITALNSMKKYPKEIYYKGNLALLERQKISIVGSRKLNPYAKELTCKLASKLSNGGVCIVSGGAIGADAIAHHCAGSHNTIMVAGTGLDKRYPSINAKLIESIEQKGLVLSQFAPKMPSNRYNFPLRNELVVALGEILIVAYADKDSGSMRSVEYALKMQKEIFVFPHRLGESNGTNELLEKGLAKAIYDIDAFCSSYIKTPQEDTKEDTFIEYCKSRPSLDEALKLYGNRVYEYELLGHINIVNGQLVTTQ